MIKKILLICMALIFFVGTSNAELKVDIIAGTAYPLPR